MEDKPPSGTINTEVEIKLQRLGLAGSLKY